MDALSKWQEVLLILAPGLVLAIFLLGLFTVYAASSARIDPAASRDEGSVLLPRLVIGFWYWLVNPIVDLLGRSGVRPNHITLFSLGLATLAAVSLGAGHFMVGCWLVVAAASCDLLDGLVARRTDSGSEAGAFLDSFADRVAEGIVFAGIAYYGAGGVLTWFALWAMLASVLVSYARARGESLGASGKSGLMQRPERLLWLVVILFAAPIGAVFLEPGAEKPVMHVAVVGVGLLALLSSLTAARRAYSIVGELQADEADRHQEVAQSGHDDAPSRASAPT